MVKRLLAILMGASMLVALFFGSAGMEVTAGLFDSPLPGPPVNDKFAKAIGVSGIPFIHNTTTEGATLEDPEPLPDCVYDNPGGSIWYAFSPSESGSVMAQTQGAWFDTYLGIYTGASLHNLTEIDSRCGYWENRLAFQASAGETYHIQIGGMWGQAGPLEFSLVSTPPPEVYLYYYPYSPSIYSTVQFYVDCWDPAYIGCETFEWDLGDGTTAEGCCPTHNFAADGDYTVELVATTYDGRTGSTSQIVQVQTHDVAITEFHTPNRAEAGETHRIVVGLSNRGPYNESVYLELYKSVPGEYWYWESIGYAYGQVPAHRANRTVDFEFAYTFTEEDATAQSVSFRVEANLSQWPDAMPGDNEAISLPTLIKPLH